MYNLILAGFPGKLERGWLGWSSSVLVKSGERNVLLDAGNWGDRPVLLSRLHSLGVEPEDLSAIVLSHLHFDHVANVECFPKAEIYVHADEVQYYEDFRGKDIALPEYQIDSILSRRKVTRLAGEEGEIGPGLRFLHTPGHTAGHISMVHEGNGAVYVFAGDAVKHRGELRMASQETGWDTEKSAASIRKILSLAHFVVPGHDNPLVATGGEVLVEGFSHETMTITFDGRKLDIDA